jgi:hypothetical protein
MCILKYNIFIYKIIFINKKCNNNILYLEHLFIWSTFLFGAPFYLEHLFIWSTVWVHIRFPKERGKDQVRLWYSSTGSLEVGG